VRAALAFVVATLGCSGPDDVPDDGTCSKDDPCNDGSVCDFTAEGGPVCVSAAEDGDGDGLTNDKDYCQHAPGGKFDEDQDGIGDDCDKCPIAPPREVVDSDGDMVDSPCDPAPNDPGDEILLFDGFAEAGLDERWKPTTPSAWSVPGGEAIVKLDTVGTQEYLATNIVGKNSISIDASYRIDKLETSSQTKLVGVYGIDPRPAGVAQAQCYVTTNDVDQTQRVVVETNTSAMNQATTAAFTTANLYRASAYIRGTMAGCVVLSNGNPLATLQTGITPDQLSQIALTARGTSARFQYIIVVGR
jgi:hypothetical protein